MIAKKRQKGNRETVEPWVEPWGMPGVNKVQLCLTATNQSELQVYLLEESEDEKLMNE